MTNYFYRDLIEAAWYLAYYKQLGGLIPTDLEAVRRSIFLGRVADLNFKQQFHVTLKTIKSDHKMLWTIIRGYGETIAAIVELDEKEGGLK